MRLSRIGLIVVTIVCIGTPVAPLHGTQVCVGCPAPKKTRITDGKWQQAIALGEGVTKTDAELIIRAARRKQITDRPLSDKFEDMRALDVQAVDYIGDASSYFAGPDPWLAQAESKVRYFGVTVGTSEGWEHIIAVRDDGRVERVAVLVWMA
jgi:hypothetical protein